MHGKSRARYVVMAAAAVVGAAFVASSAFLADSAGAAAPKTVTVTFGQNGPTPATVQLQAGDSVKFLNKVPQAGSLLLSGVLAQIQSAEVNITGATAASDRPINLPHADDAFVVRYPSAGTVKFQTTYTYHLLGALGIPLEQTTTPKTHAGTVTIAAAPQTGSGGSGGGGSVSPGGGGSSPVGGGQQGGVPAVPNGGGAGTPLPHGGNSVSGGGTGYTPQGPSVADRTVPQGSGSGSYGGNSAQQQAQPQTPLGAHTPSGGGTLPQLPSDGSEALLAGSAPNAGLGVPAVLAIVLLSVVTAALVRAFITQRRTVLN